MKAQTLTTNRRLLVLFPFAAAFAILTTTATARAKHDTISDRQITEAIERALIEDPGVGTDPITVSVEKGVVTLSGSVHDLRTVWRAVERAEDTKGVRSVVNTLEIEPAFRSDKEIRNDVELALEHNRVTENFPIEVEVVGGGVTLAGTVQSWQEKQITTEVVGGVRGIAAIHNWLRVDFAAPRSDKVIARDIQEIFRWDAKLDAGLIDVAVDNGNVTLTGTVGSAAERTRAERDAHTLGVKSVKSDGVKVKWWAKDEMTRERPSSTSDAEVRAAVDDALRQDPRIYEPSVTTAVHDGEVTLTGTVENLWSREAAIQDALNTVGVLRVHNFLKVHPQDRVSDDILPARVRAALDRDPDLNRYDIKATAYDGTVVLLGTLPSDFDRDLADEVVSRVIGVAAVEDLIGVTGMAERKPDWQMQEDIHSELWWSPYVNADKVHVSVRDGVATLSGVVDTWRERQAAEINAREGGARRVRNEIELKTWQ